MSSNSDDRSLERRIAAVERAVDGSERMDPDTAAVEREPLESRLAAVEQRVDELDAALQAVRGFLGGVDAVNEAVESRADAAIAAVDRLERRLDEAAIESEQRRGERGQRQEPSDPPDGSDSVVDDWVTGDDGVSQSETPVREVDEPSPESGGSSADEAGDRTLRDRLSEQW